MPYFHEPRHSSSYCPKHADRAGARFLPNFCQTSANQQIVLADLQRAAETSSQLYHPANADDLLREFDLPTMRRWPRLMLAVAARHGIGHLLLGAWGCGVFANDPAQIAGLFAEVLAHPNIWGRFRRLGFAVFDPKSPQVKLRAFERILKPFF